MEKFKIKKQSQHELLCMVGSMIAEMIECNAKPFLSGISLTPKGLTSIDFEDEIFIYHILFKGTKQK